MLTSGAAFLVEKTRPQLQQQHRVLEVLESRDVGITLNCPCASEGAFSALASESLELSCRQKLMSGPRFSLPRSLSATHRHRLAVAEAESVEQRELILISSADCAIVHELAVVEDALEQM